MKTFAMLLLLAGMGLSGGCAASGTPAYSGEERFAQIGRNWNYEYQQIADDTDHLLLLRPNSRLSVWNIYHRD